MTVFDQGLPLQFEAAPTGAGLLGTPIGCLPIHSTICGLQPSSHEQARAVLNLDFSDPRTQFGVPAVLSVQGDTFIDLQTTADDQPETITRTGHTHLTFSNPLSTEEAGFVLGSFAAAWVSAVPEPDVSMLLVCGLGLLVATQRVRRRIVALHAFC